MLMDKVSPLKFKAPIKEICFIRRMVTSNGRRFIPVEMSFMHRSLRTLNKAHTSLDSSR